jgi:hypothetical protein
VGENGIISVRCLWEPWNVSGYVGYTITSFIIFGLDHSIALLPATLLCKIRKSCRERRRRGIESSKIHSFQNGIAFWCTWQGEASRVRSLIISNPIPDIWHQPRHTNRFSLRIPGRQRLRLVPM